MRHFSAALVGAIVVFIWGFAAWAALDVYAFAFPRAQNEVAITSVLKEHLTEDGAYFLPMMPVGYGNTAPDEATQKSFDDFESRIRSGPVALILYHSAGKEPMAPKELIQGFAIEFICAHLLTCMLSVIPGSICRRVFFGFAIALFGATACYGVSGNFMHFPLGFTFACWIDAVVSWTLCSLVIALILKGKTCKYTEAACAAKA